MRFRSIVTTLFALYGFVTTATIHSAFSQQKQGTVLSAKKPNALSVQQQTFPLGKMITETALATHSEALPANILQEFHLEHFSSKEGFANEEVVDILQDRHGFLWVLTLAALYRYDGQTFKRYSHNKQDSTSLLPTYYTALCEDSNGRLWISGTQGIQRYNSQRDCFDRVRLGASSYSLHTPAEIYAIGNDSVTGNLWLCMNEEVWNFNTVESRVMRRYSLPQQTIEGKHNINAIHIERNGRVWVTRWNSGNVFVLDNPSLEFRIGASLPFANTNPAVFAHQDSLWVGVDNAVMLWSIREQRILAAYPLTPRFQARSSIQQSSFVLIRRICRDTQGRIWVASSDGVAIIYPQTSQIQAFRHNSFDERSLTTNDINVVYQDRSGVMWIGETVYGLHKYAPLQYKFRLHRNNPFNAQTLSSSYIRGITEDQQGNVWVGTQFGGLNMLDRKSGAWKRFRYDSTSTGSITSDHVRGIYCDRRGILWVAVRGGLLCTLDTKRPERGFVPQNFIKNGIHAECFYEDRSGALWISTSTSEPLLYRLSADRTTVEEVHSSRQFPGIVAGAQSIIEDRRGRIWIGSINGLMFYAPEHKVIRQFQPNINDSTALPHSFVTYITETRSGDIWIATKGGGICKFLPETESFAKIGTADGLPHENCYGILEDAQGELWISSDNGICAYSPTTKTVRRFGVEDGLQGTEFNRLAVFQSKRGEIFFGGVDGLNSFFPSNIRLNGMAPKPIVARVQSLSGTMLADIIALSGRSDVEIPPQTDISLHFAALEYTQPKKNLYSWQLDGFDTSWSAPTSTPEAIYSHLAPGEYLLRLRVANADGVWSRTESMLKLIVVPAWWQRWSVRVALVLALAGVILLIVRWRVRRIEVRAKELQTLVDTRTMEIIQANQELQTTNEQLSTLNREMQEVMGIVSHDLKNPISAVMGFVDVLQQSDSFQLNNEQTQEILTQISTTGERMMTMLKNLLDMNALESGTIVSRNIPMNVNTIARAVVDEYRPRAAVKDITLHFIEVQHDLILADEMMIYQVLANIVSNAVKYSPTGKNIWVRMSNRDEAGQVMVRFSVKDEGPGISASDQTKLFARFSKLSARPTAGEDSTGLGLFIVKKMVASMNGKVWCESELGHGAKFIVEFPLQPDELLQTYRSKALLHFGL
ncbi:MAG: ATP-binding protein [Candidatus Kapabacteria bacterium]|jgi:signal transduction histidine kinase/ligand-binding sensor domain-containing protein|nr:ATP-binding protein [Candidatus Kapabacteria bacterium]